MVGNIVLSFFTLASAFQLKAPLPPYLPPAEHSRLRLVRPPYYSVIHSNLSLHIGTSYSST